ncbi:MAG: ABC transporter substrate-binding protein [Actinobacteria bacterium]|nr:ABC transporter substrate-binding protein [Actinomycetota bacterium]
MQRRAGIRRWAPVVAAVMAFGLIATACGGSSSSSSQSGKTSDVTIKASGPPKAGGSVKFGLEAETDGFNPSSNRWAIAGYMIGNAVFDPLSAYDANGNWAPYLAKAFTSSADFKTWTVDLRAGVTFSDGTPVDATAVKLALDKVKANALTGAALANMGSITVVSASQLTISTVDAWASLPAVLTTQVGFIAAPAQLNAEGAAASRLPIGSGPFIQKEWIPDNHWTGTKNAKYWRSDDKGNKLPYLDSVEFRPIVDPQNRVNALLSGDVQMIHTTDWPAINRLQSEAASGNIQFVADGTETEEQFLMFNTQKAPVDDVRVRQGLTLCTDPTAVLVVQETPAGRSADSQFTKDSPWYSNSGFTTNDVAKGKALLDQVKAEKGPIVISLGTTPVPANTNTTALIKQQWEACGVTVNTTTSEQSKFVSDAVTGNYTVDLFRQFAASDPDGDYVWWTPKNAVGPLTLNIARLADTQIGAALDKARASNDVAVRKQAYADLQKRQTELAPYIWISHSQWAIGAAKNIRNITNQTLPDGQAALPFQRGEVRLTQTWLDN